MVTLEQQLSRLDLNLLVSLSVLLKEKNVTRAAESLFLSQPAMSRTLNRLRDLFDDPLFYRESNGLAPTQKAIELQKPLDELLRAAQSLVAKTAFSPEKCDQTFVVSIPPLMSSFLSSALVKALNQRAPNASLVEFPIAESPTRQLASRDVDFSIHIDPPKEANEFPFERVGETYPVFYVSAQHPLASKKNVTLEDCLAYRFVDMSLDIRSGYGMTNPVDALLSKRNIVRDIAFKSGQLHTLVEVMQSTDRVMVSSHKLESLSYLSSKLVPVFALSDDPELTVQIYVIEHQRNVTSAAHIWFKDLMISTIRDHVFDRHS